MVRGGAKEPDIKCCLFEGSCGYCRFLDLERRQHFGSETSFRNPWAGFFFVPLIFSIFLLETFTMVYTFEARRDFNSFRGTQLQKKLGKTENVKRIIECVKLDKIQMALKNLNLICFFLFS